MPKPDLESASIMGMVMAGIMTAHCGQCGHENNPEYRFCGVCGAPLLPPVAAREAPAEKPSHRVAGPSFLGLGDERTRDLDYLLEDEPPRGHKRLYLALLLLVASGALLVWHWQRDGYPWEALIPRPTRSPGASGSAPSAAASTQPAQVPAPENLSAAPAAAATAAPSPPAPADKPGETTPAAANPAAGTKAIPSPEAANPADTAATGAASAPAAPEPAKPPAAMPAESVPESVTADETPLKSPAPAPREMAKKAAVAKPAPVAPPVDPDERIVAEGERYLYGHGVRSDCSLAQRNLMIGAGHSNTKAQTLLGAMYATGHCVNRDLPTAYRWFARALHGDPANFRLQRNLEVLWKQMTPEERQIAMKSQ